MRAVFLDRDGTLNEDDGYVHKASDLRLLPRVIEGLKNLSQEFSLFVVTNQSGVARGLFTENDLKKFHQALQDLLQKNSVSIADFRSCLHSPENKCGCRKPGIGMIQDLSRIYPIDPTESWMIGDKLSDIECAHNAGLRSVLLLTGAPIAHLENLQKIKPDYIAKDLEFASRFIRAHQDSKIVDRSQLQQLVDRLTQEQKKIVTLNGSFDILHEGHEQMIREAREQGDVLIVGLNSDLSVKGNKGPLRPFNNQSARARMLASYSEIDFVALFDESNPIPLLEIIRPRVHVNGADYGMDCIEAPTVKKYGGRIHIAKFIPDVSTTKLLERKMGGST